MTCDSDVVSYGGDGFAAFFASLAHDWRGWKGTRAWNTLEHGLSINATHTGNRVELLIVLRRDDMPDAWEAHVPILVAPGESLPRLASASRELDADGN